MNSPRSPHVYLLHGLGADRRAFQRFERLLPGDWQITALDLLGHGEAPKPEHGYALEDHAEYISTQLPAGAAVTLVGHSYGAATAVALAALHPERVSDLVLLDPVIGTREGSDGVQTGRMAQAKRDGTIAETVRALFPAASPALQNWTIATWEQMSVGVVDELDLDWTRCAERVTCPVTVIHGDVEHGGAGDLAADWFEDPVMVRIPGAGHYLHATHARETAAAVADAVSRVAR